MMVNNFTLTKIPKEHYDNNLQFQERDLEINKFQLTLNMKINKKKNNKKI